LATAVLVFAEHKDGQWRKVTAELLTQGRRLADQLGGELGAMLLGQGVAGMAESLGQYGVDKVYLADDERLANYTTDAYTTVVTDLVKSLGPQVVLFGHTHRQEVETRQGTVFISAGSTGAEGIRGLLGTEPGAYSLAVLYWKQGDAGWRLVAVDLIRVPAGEHRFILERRLFSAPEEQEPSSEAA